MLSDPAAGLINHVLRGADWARARLAPFAGSVVRFVVPPAASSFRITPDGMLAASGGEVEPDAIVHLELPTLIRIVLLGDESARQQIRVERNAELAAALTGVLRGLRWDIEEDLSHVLGDVAARRLTRAGAALRDWHIEVASSLAASMVEYWTEERPLVVAREPVRDFVAAVDALREDVDRLEKRIQGLAAGLPPTQKA
ncbi:MAG TPA: hypothetical protein VMH32_03110 [Burkholderiales bacterium]|nr:hypothetical protein [Burkholderiales bacterium]